LTLANGDLFPKGIAFSPGFIPASDSPDVGKPKFFESHGRQDAVLPIGSASRRIVPALQQRGYAVQYREFDGGHQVPADVLAAAADFIMA
jgi:predicted esterase